MAGNHTQRHCDSCNKSVHDLSFLNPIEILRLVDQHPEGLCACVTRKTDGSLLTRSTRYAPAVLLAGALAAAPAYSQAATPVTPAGEPTFATLGQVELVTSAGLDLPPGPQLTALLPSSPELATVTGTTLLPGDTPPAVSFASFSQNGTEKLTVKADPAGHWAAELPAGTYDVKLYGYGLPVLQIPSVQLHPGAQDFGRITVSSRIFTSVTVGEVLISYQSAPFFALRHPLWTLKRLHRKLFHSS